MISATIKNFMKQQGFSKEEDAACGMHFAGLNFQPRIVGTLVLLGIFLQIPAYFFALSAVLWWNVLIPNWNPFEVFYNGAFGIPRGKPRLTPAPPPRRFAQAMAATFMLLAACALLQGWIITAWVVEALLVIAFAALLFGKFCLGAYIYHLLAGRTHFANATLPWARRPD